MRPPPCSPPSNVGIHVPLIHSQCTLFENTDLGECLGECPTTEFLSKCPNSSVQDCSITYCKLNGVLDLLNTPIRNVYLIGHVAVVIPKNIEFHWLTSIESSTLTSRMLSIPYNGRESKCQQPDSIQVGDQQILLNFAFRT